MSVDLADVPVALVTGASRGIGAACSIRLARDGFHVCINARSVAGPASEVLMQIEELGGSAQILEADVGDEGAVRDMVRTLKRTHGRLDVLVNNAGVTADGYLMMMSAQKWSSVLHTNLTGAFFCAREAAKLMSLRGSGSIVNVASVSGLVPPAGQANYAAAKAGLIAMGNSLAAEVADRGIRVNSVVPGFIDTSMLRAMPPEALAAGLSHVPMKRVGTAEEVAAAVSWLAGPEASYVTGATLVVDGGLTRA